MLAANVNVMIQFYQFTIMAHDLWVPFRFYIYISFRPVAQGLWPLDNSLFGQYWFHKIFYI